jgi:hypothetical protein
MPQATPAASTGQWVDDLAVAGAPEECALKITRLLDAGATGVSLFRCPVERASDMIELAGSGVLPLVTSPVR